ncbi:SDR family NAD(P)-dependent oxidoreductase [Streptosporangium lutulentum]|uniref:NAD(P)-dependent dehydrogenase (Short-subunit alcohol dehydrogenase family) n=1 Tax=Streptosporangium lutulentum TaxID=1461250 RepID=A0ABT9QIX6_9ACTN|nr:SDR family NAD(P)-dependent oxidoreductase [Streptosporangium lutulentum]MDP9846700.1 NAD(P)-dependent dehydrogenase (short-subunit alcohol dehydrogenase family) [Streptosporangium lutulentum]
MRELSGKIAVVTGAAGGIGRALALRLAAEGMALMLADVDPGGLAETASLLDGVPEGVKVLTQITDVSDAAAVQHLADRTFGEFGAVHVLCNNAGVFQGGQMWTREPEDFAWLLGVNLLGTLHGIRAFVPRMIAQDTEGHILNTVSVAGLFAMPFGGAYSISKYAALAASQSLAHDLAMAGSKLRVTALCPGLVKTGIGHSERVRPENLTVAERTEDEVASIGFMVDLLKDGIDPAEAALAAVEGIREERFLVFTHPGYAEGLREQTETLISGGLPPFPRRE